MKDKKPLSRYFSILEGDEKARYLLCGNLQDKVEEAENIMECCHFCERRCNVNRLRGERGYCRVLEPRISSEFIHIGEEPELVPSHTIFFAGCTFRCVYCQNWDISQHPERGSYIKPDGLARLIESRTARNVNWVGGDPTPNIAYILKVLEALDKNTPQVWNSNMYLTEDAMNLLDGVVDVYLTDFKYGNDECAERLSDVRDYMRITERNHEIAGKQAELLIRHLMLPGHLDCCTIPILEWIAENTEAAKVNIMAQYRPMYRAMDYPELRGRLDFRQYNEALNAARDLGLNLTQ